MNSEPAIRVLVIGNAEWKDTTLVEEDLAALRKRHACGFRLFTREPRGAEPIAIRYAREHGWSDEGAVADNTSKLTPRERATAVVNNIKPNYVFVYLTLHKPSRDVLALIRAASRYARAPATQLRLLTSRRCSLPPPVLSASAAPP